MDDQPHDPNAPGHDAATCSVCSGDAPAADEDPLKQVQQTVADEHEQHQQDEASK
ncbi:hypothetical protein HY375_03410 [Candidatus Berkelbacteria bacterium]|nr:hypothetical protein [Candidatus Berkelbacteria bacterium]